MIFFITLFGFVEALDSTFGTRMLEYSQLHELVTLAKLISNV